MLVVEGVESLAPLEAIDLATLVAARRVDGLGDRGELDAEVLEGILVSSDHLGGLFRAGEREGEEGNQNQRDQVHAPTLADSAAGPPGQMQTVASSATFPSMKRLHRDDLWGWSLFNEERNLDFHSVLWVREGGNVAVDPLPLSAHDAAHLEALGGLSTIVITNSDHLRDAPAIAERTGARILGPAGERRDFPHRCDDWIADGDEVVPGLGALALEGSKTPGEL